MTFPLVSAVTAALLLIVQQLLMLNVGLYRVKVKRGVGHDGDMTLERLVRRHGNFTENAAIFVIALALLELLLGSASLIVLGFAISSVMARMMHILGFASPAGSHLTRGHKLFLIMRSGGATLTALTGLALGLTLVVAALS
ncbi:MAG: MAPEG family protein [Rhodothalassiaceae bacterium]